MNRILKGVYFVGACVAIIVAIGMFVEFKFLERIIISEMETVNQLQRDHVSDEINTELQLKGQVISDAAAYISGETEEEHILNYLKSLMQANPGFASIYFGTPDNLMVNASGWIPTDGFDLRTRPWYQKAIKENRRIFTEAFLNASKEQLVVTVAMPIYSENGTLQGVVAGDIALENILNIKNDDWYSESGYTLLIDSEGNILASTNDRNDSSTLVPRNIRDISERLASVVTEAATGTIPFELDGTHGFLSYEPVPETDWIICNFESVETYFKYETQMIHHFFITILSTAFVVFIALLLQKKYVIKPLHALDQDIRKISVEQDITYRLPLHSDDPFRMLRESLNGILEKTESFFKQSETHKDEFATANEKLKTSLLRLAATEIVLRDQFEELTESQEALKAEEERSRAILNALPDLVFRLDEVGVILDYHASDESLLKIKKDEFIGKPLQDILPKSVVTISLEAITKALREHRLQTLEYSLDLSKGERFFEMRVAESSAREVIAIIRDITDQKLSQRHIEHLSYHDQLTGLYNRRFFVQEFRRLDEEGTLPYTVAMLDVNGLKLTNNAFGHQAGDELLMRVASVLIAESRPGDTVARIGGDEFVMLLPKTSHQEAEQIVKHIMKAFSKEKLESVVLSVSVGWETKTSSEQPRKNIFARAEEHMYRKKLVESQSMHNATIQVILRTLNETNERERVHSDKVSALCAKIAMALQLDSDSIKEVEMAGLMHDIGKIAININLLNKAGALTEAEYEEVQRHAEVGYQILKSVDTYSPLAECVLSHHEKWDGSGYPRGLKEKEIPLYARIIAIADAYEAMVSDRPYRDAMPKNLALDELYRFAGIQFDPEIIEVVVEMERMEQMR